MRHKNKTLATFLALVAGSIGAHRFYLRGSGDLWGWLHLASVPLSAALWAALPGQPLLFVGAPWVLSALVGELEALIIGLTPDARWDESHNPASGRQSRSRWLLVFLLVVAMSVGVMGLLAAIARTFDLLLTGGAYG
ncbi:MAG: NINE protein [Burkholderiaceae bacterium]